jgi:hypothetical protein
MFEWQDTPPKENGHFYYTGPIPGTARSAVAIVEIATKPDTDERWVFLLTPNVGKNKMPELTIAELEKWTGEWAGPTYGLLTVTNHPE